MIMTDDERQTIKQKAEILKTISHPVRLCIVTGLLREPCCNVNKITGCLGMPQSTISQHLAKLKTAGIVEGVRNGLEVNYSVSNQDVVQLIKCLKLDLKRE